MVSWIPVLYFYQYIRVRFFYSASREFLTICYPCQLWSEEKREGSEIDGRNGRVDLDRGPGRRARLERAGYGSKLLAVETGGSSHLAPTPLHPRSNFCCEIEIATLAFTSNWRKCDCVCVCVCVYMRGVMWCVSEWITEGFVVDFNWIISVRTYRTCLVLINATPDALSN